MIDRFVCCSVENMVQFIVIIKELQKYDYKRIQF